MSEDSVEPTEVSQRVESVAASVESRLGGSLTDDGRIDMERLKSNDEALFKVLDAYAVSKTWRDDPEISASDVAKLLEAQSRTTPLGAALESLRQSFVD